MTGRRTNTRPCGTPGCTQPRGHLGLCTEESLPRVEDEAEVHGTTDTCATVADHSAAPSARGSVGGLGVASTRTRRGISQPRQQVTSLVATLLDPRNELTRFFCDQVEDCAKCRLVQTAHVVREIVVTMQPEVHTEGCAQSPRSAGYAISRPPGRCEASRRVARVGPASTRSSRRARTSRPSSCTSVPS